MNDQPYFHVIQYRIHRHVQQVLLCDALSRKWNRDYQTVYLGCNLFGHEFIVYLHKKTGFEIEIVLYYDDFGQLL